MIAVVDSGPLLALAKVQAMIWQHVGRLRRISPPLVARLALKARWV
jgi:hypothetical protein